MKLRILSVIAFFLFSVLHVNAQCTPGTSTTSGITPDSATGFAAATMGQYYSQVLQIRVPVDTVAELAPGVPVTVNIVSIQLNSFAGLPAGLTYSCNPSNCIFPGGSNGCIEIFGTPTTSGVYPLTAIVTTTASLFGQPIIQVDTINYYVLTVNTSIGLTEFSAQGFSLSQNTPNPFSDITIINFFSPLNTDVEFRIYNMIGMEVHYRELNAEAGKNLIRLDSRDFAPGIYMYAMTLAGKTISQRMVVTKK